MSVTRRYFVLFLELSSGYGIYFLKNRGYHIYLDTTTSLHHINGSLRSHKACPPRDSTQEHWCPQPTLIPNQIYQTNMDPHQIFLTDVGAELIISSHCRNSPLRCCNKSQPMWAPIKYMQQMLGLPQSLSGLEHLCCQTPRILPTFTNRHCGPTN